ncbi:suppressor of cytokine signaling 2-like isoform X2 [Rhodnius prolixus]|uniref:suppressor of cytokine signaling 2-like isoform X2 n=1 Tax=Rhodnius prolixus TaxID=13249 RepID=UPI003D18C4AA
MRQNIFQGSELVMLTSCPRCQHTFRAPCCGLPSPEPSPSLPLTFILPSPPINPKPYRHHSPHRPEVDLERLSCTLRCLRISGWYFEGVNWQESIGLLAATKPGTFLVRDSSDPRYLFSLSIQRAANGPTSVRIHYRDGYFRLDAEPSLVPNIPIFDCVVKLIEYYVGMSSYPNKGQQEQQVLLDRTGQKYSHILLKSPLYQRTKFPSLQHLARLKVNSLLKNGVTVPKLNIPVILKEYLLEYPYTL